MALGNVDYFVLIALASIVISMAFARRSANSRHTAVVERDEMESRLREAETQLEDLSVEYATVVEQCGVGILVLDRAGAILRANANAAEWLQAPVSSLIG